MRQYERYDCSGFALETDSLEVATANIAAGGTYNCDLVTIFGNPSLGKAVWVPYGSKIQIKDEIYTVVRGKLSEFHGLRAWTYDQSINCFQDSQGNLLSMWDFDRKPVRIQTLNNDVEAAIAQLRFDLIHKKTGFHNPHLHEEYDPTLEARLVRYGIPVTPKNIARLTPALILPQVKTRVSIFFKKIFPVKA